MGQAQVLLIKFDEFRKKMDFKDIYLFENLNDQQILRLKQLSSVKEFKKDNMLFFEGDIPKNLYILIEGVLRVFKSDFKGNEVVLKYFHPVSLIAELANLDHIPYPASAVFEEDGKVLVVNFKIFEQEFFKNHDVLLSIIKSLTKKLKGLEEVIARGLTMDSTSRVAKFIYENENLFLELRQNKISGILNITPETMSRVLKKFKDSGIIESRDRKFRVIDKKKLEDFF